MPCDRKYDFSYHTDAFLFHSRFIIPGVDYPLAVAKRLERNPSLSNHSAAIWSTAVLSLASYKSFAGSSLQGPSHRLVVKFRDEAQYPDRIFTIGSVVKRTGSRGERLSRTSR